MDAFQDPLVPGEFVEKNSVVYGDDMAKDGTDTTVNGKDMAENGQHTAEDGEKADSNGHDHSFTALEDPKLVSTRIPR
ncbi:hypothetical protein BDN71DRAFT_1507500 [Pleurotus eryngii]|uniref:Uncharacterized protein n=1 Tax=Pleurotus eryngii TaxID=5323 RepID=A0A9P6DEZ7_PLEER|nr:hypothetical protein BDN71DRAFT_1507500 [Pleurotus eryngii]